MPAPAEHVIGFPRESTPGDRRTLLTPRVASLLREAGFGVIAEPGIGAGVFCDDAELAADGVRFAKPDEVWAAPLVLRYKSADPNELARLRPAQSIGALFHAEGDAGLLSALAASQATAYSYEFVAEDGRFPLATPGGEIAGSQAVLHGAHALQTVHGGRGVLLARVAGAAAPRVVVIGCGNVGSAAARTAAALGAEVTVLARSEGSASRYLPTAGPVQRPGDPPREVQGVLHVKLDALPALAPVTTTEAYTANAAPYLVRLARVALLGVTDPVIEAARIAQHGRLVHSVCRQHAAFYGLPA